MPLAALLRLDLAHPQHTCPNVALHAQSESRAARLAFVGGSSWLAAAGPRPRIRGIRVGPGVGRNGPDPAVAHQPNHPAAAAAAAVAYTAGRPSAWRDRPRVL